MAATSCSRVMEEDMPGQKGLPEGTPITMRLDFGYEDIMTLDVSTKAEASASDEERIHDLYVMIFCNGTGEGHPHPGQKIYGRYFSYEHLQSSFATMDSSPNESWYVENRTLDNVTTPVAKTRGAVKISTRVCTSARIVVIANVNNGICKLGDQEDVLDYLNNIWSYDELVQTQVKLTQDVVNRKDLFLMMGVPEDGEGNPKNVNTGEMQWGTTSPSISYNEEYKVSLRPVDAKVKFKVRINNPEITAEYGEYISAAKAVYWQVCNAPDRCYLFSDYRPEEAPEGTYPAPDGTVYFDSEPAYFEGTVTEDGDEWYVFSFYMLESRFAARASASNYYQRELRDKTDTGKTGYTVEDGYPYIQRDDDHYVENGDWIYADTYAAYAKFDMILTLTPAGISALGGSVTHALTSDTIYTVHLGDFSNSGNNDYNTYRSTCYTYKITIANAGTIYAEVKRDNERQPGQEGYLLLTDDEIVNADAHYEYHSITFYYDPETTPEKFSWYVKTPFTDTVGGGPQKATRTVNGTNYPIYDPHTLEDNTLLDYRWVKFSINTIEEDGKYSTKRVAYPGDGAYHKDWGSMEGDDGPWNEDEPDHPRPVLMDISQLIQYIFEQTRKESASGSSDFREEPSGLGDDLSTLDVDESRQKVIRATIFIDEYYYEYDPRDESENPQPDPNLWRQFVNAPAREMHILSRTVQSRDRMSDVIESSHSVIQESIQTIYNIYEPTLRSIWGCEHLDEIKYTTVDGKTESDPAGDWLYWPEGCSDDEKKGKNDNVGKENGRLNTAYMWGLYSSQDNGGNYYLVDGEGKRYWKHFLKYEVNNRVPELRDDTDGDTYGTDDGTHRFHGMAFSCLTRNRDNNGNGKIDEDEVRWYMAASQQLAGLWVGNESLSNSARLYQPAEGQWRAHVVSSTDKRVAWSEEGAGATLIETDWANGGGPPQYTGWADAYEAARGETVRCIRNIGTYDDPSEGLKDISYASVKILPDRYFTLNRVDNGVEVDNLTWGGVDDYYVFHFDRLNTKSIREFTPGELPYHDQMSLNNRVYLKMVTQPLSKDVPTYSVNLGDINNNVTQKGHNDYCPEGYRFPNHTEMLLMELYLPSRFLQKNAKGKDYAHRVYPTRTFYNRGYYGSLRSDTEPWRTEKVKVGWMYSDKMHCSPYGEKVYQSRCVKDEDQTGVVSGKIAVEGNVIYPGDVIPVDFKFSTMASTFTSATLTLWYTNSSGLRTPYDLTSQLTQPSGLQYQKKLNIQFPSLTDLGIYDVNFSSANMTLEAEFFNLNGRSNSDALAIAMRNPLGGECEITDADEDRIFPSDKNDISLNLKTDARSQSLTSVSLTLCYDGQEIPITLPALSPGKKAYSLSEIDIPTLASLTGISVSDLNAGDKNVVLKATVSTTYPNTRDLLTTETLTKVFTQNLKLSNPVQATGFSISDATDNKVYPGDKNHVSFSFSSRGNIEVLSSASLKLMKGETEVADYTSSLSTPYLNVYEVSDLEIDIPALSASLALDDNLRLVATVGNADGLYKSRDVTGLVLSNPVSGTLSAEYVYPADDNSISFDVSNHANTSELSSVEFKVTYTGIDGIEHVVNSGFSGLTSPSGKVYSGNQTVTFPVLSANPATDVVDTSLPVTLTATFTTDGGIAKEITCDVPVRSHINVPVLQIPTDYTGTSPSFVFPVKAKLGDTVGGYTVSAMKLQWKKNGETVWTTDTYDFDESNTDFQTVTDASTRASLDLSTGSYINYRAMSICSTDGTAAFSPVWSMWLARYNFTKSDTEKWSFDIQNLSIPRGDFIQASITPTGGYNVETNMNSAKYELIGFGAGDSESVFYPAPKSATPDMTIHVQRRDGNLRVYGWYHNASNWQYAHYTSVSPPINVLFNSDGLYYQNSNLFDPTKVDKNNLTANITNLINATRMQVGSAQGVERPFATYHFVRVVRQYEIPEP